MPVPAIARAHTPPTCPGCQFPRPNVRCRYTPYIKPGLASPLHYAAPGSFCIAAVVLYICINFRGTRTQSGFAAVAGLCFYVSLFFCYSLLCYFPAGRRHSLPGRDVLRGQRDLLRLELPVVPLRGRVVALHHLDQAHRVDLPHAPAHAARGTAAVVPAPVLCTGVYRHPRTIRPGAVITLGQATASAGRSRPSDSRAPLASRSQPL